MGLGLLPNRAAVTPSLYSRRFQNGIRSFNEVCGRGLVKLGREKDLEQFTLRLLLSFAQFTNLNTYIPFLEMVRHALKKEAKKGKGLPDDFVILKAMKSAVECHCQIQGGSWTQASLLLMHLSTVKPEANQEPLFNSVTLSQKT